VDDAVGKFVVPAREAVQRPVTDEFPPDPRDMVRGWGGDCSPMTIRLSLIRFI